MTNYTPPPEAVEAAAAAIERDLVTRTAPPDRISGQGGLGLTCEQIATAALTAAGPIIAAQALRGAADALDRDDMAADRWYAAWLRDRADRLVRGEEVDDDRP